jgi:phosphoglycolate phosphatase
MQVTQLKTIILDLDGPILDGIERHYQCYYNILVELGATPMPISQYWQLKRSGIDRRTLLGYSGAESLYDAFLKRWVERIEEKRYLLLDRLQVGALAALEAWCGVGIKLILATMRNNPEHLAWQLDDLGIARFFGETIVVGSRSPGNGKAEAVDRLIQGAATDSVIWVGDTEIDIEAAHSLGLRVCALTCGLRDSAFLQARSPDLICADLNALLAHINRQVHA